MSATTNLSDAATNLVATQAKAVNLFHSSPSDQCMLFWAVGLSAALMTFVASVMADEQNERLRNGTFGAIAGSSVGGITALLETQNEFLIIGFLGSAIGAFCGWIAIVLFSFIARTPKGRNWLDYYVGGFKALRAKIELDDAQTVLAAVAKWRHSFSKMIDAQKNILQTTPKSKELDFAMRFAISSWLDTSTDFFGLVFETLAKKPAFRSRAAVIVFGAQDNKVIGKIWLSHVGALPAFKPMDFDETSIAYKVLSGQIESPHLTSKEEAKAKGQERGRVQYRPFFIQRVNKTAVLVIDWPDDPPEQDSYIEVAIDVYRRDIGPATEALLEHWSLPSCSHIVSLAPLP